MRYFILKLNLNLLGMRNYTYIFWAYLKWTNQGLESRTFYGRSYLTKKYFDSQILSNSNRFWMSMQRAVLDIHFMTLLEDITQPEFLRIR